MAFFISPAVITQERDLTLYVQEDSDSIGATAGVTQWGPAGVPTLITQGETEYVGRFFKPDDNTYLSVMTTIDFLSYSKKCWFTRVVGANASNAVEGGISSSILVKNEDEAQTANLSGIQFLSKYPGALGNGITVDIADKAKFANWEFKSSFDYQPADGEYAIAVIDGSGKFTGTGKAKQVERLGINGTVSGGVREVRQLTFSGTVAGGVHQVENLTISGTASAAGNLTIGGVVVAIAAGDSATQVATKVAAALEASAPYAATASGTTVTVTYSDVLSHTALSMATTLGISLNSSIAVAGNDAVTLNLYGISLSVKNGDTAQTVRDLFATAAATKSYINLVASVNTDKVVITYDEFGPQAYATTTQTDSGVSVATTVTTPGSNNTSISVFGRTVAVLNKDTASQVAVKVAAVLAADVAFTTLYEGVAADKATVVYTRKVYGKVTKQTVPDSQVSLTFSVDTSVAGRLGTLLEKYELMNQTKGSKFSDGSIKYFADAINKSSKYVIVGDKSIPLTARTAEFSNGFDDYDVNLSAAISEYSNSEKMDVNYIFGAFSIVEQKAAIDVVDTRRDAIAFISPMFEDVVNNKGNEMTSVIEWRSIEVNRESSYTFNDDNWALVYDQYNDVNRWIPACGGTAGLKARTDADQDPWVSPAGHQRGRYKRYIKTAWSASKEQRDELYKIGVNSIVNFPAEGILLYGDKTSMSRPSAFGHINVRAAFIVAEKSIANFAKQFLFEVNDAFTRAQFLNAVRPFLRNMVARRAFEDFRVIADETNNDGAIRAENKMQGKILLKPLYSINYVILDFTAVRPDVSFDEIEG